MMFLGEGYGGSAIMRTGYSMPPGVQVADSCSVHEYMLLVTRTAEYRGYVAGGLLSLDQGSVSSVTHTHSREPTVFGQSTFMLRSSRSCGGACAGTLMKSNTPRICEGRTFLTKGLGWEGPPW